MTDADIRARMDAQDRKLDEILTQAKLTNGRVTAIERWRIEVLAIEAERSRVAAAVDEQHDEQSTNRSRRTDRLLAALVGMGGVLIGAVLSDTHPFR